MGFGETPSSYFGEDRNSSYIDVHVAKDEPNMFHIALFLNDYKLVFFLFYALMRFVGGQTF